MSRYILCFGVLLFVFSSCDEEPEVESVHGLVGTWDLTELTMTQGSTVITILKDDDNNQIFIFNVNGTYSYVTEMDGVHSSGNGTWSTTDNNLTVIENGETNILSYSISSGILTMIVTDVNDGVTSTIEQVFQKQ